MHLVLDHSAVIPWGSKPEEEKRAIHKLGNMLPDIVATWHVSRKYLKTLYQKLAGYREPLPRFQSGLLRVGLQLLELADARNRRCNPFPLKGEKLKIHVMGRDIAAALDEGMLKLADSEDDREVLALALLTSRLGSLYLVSADHRLLDAAARLNIVKAVTPSQFLSEISPPATSDSANA